MSALAGAKYLRFLLTMTRAATKMLTRKTTIKKKTKKKKNVKTREDVTAARATRALKARHLTSICGEIIAKGAKTRVGFHEV